MKSVAENIHPTFHRILQREDKEKLLNQRARVIWLTGLSGSGKSTIAEGLEKRLHAKKIITQILDGDNIRAGINHNLGFTDADRLENIRRIAEVSKLFLNCGVITINSFVSPTNDVRKLAKEIIGEKDFIEIFVSCPLEICEQRDVKGLYAKARRGEIKDFTGISAPFEAPASPQLEVKTNELTVEEATEKVFSFILPLVTIK